MRIFLSGSGGFIGRHLKTFLGKKHELLSPRSSELNLLDSGSVDSFFAENKVDFIIHSAALGVRVSPEATLEQVALPNIEMFKNLARHAGSKCPMIVFGSGAEYDKSRALCKVKESDFGQSVPKDAYGYSKYCISKEIEKSEHILNLRIFGIYGLGESPTRVTSCIVNDNLNRGPMMMNQNVVYDFIYIDDLCDIVGKLLKNFPDKKFLNLTPTDSVETKTLAKIVNAFSDYKSDIVFKRGGMNLEYTGDNSELLAVLGGYSFTPYEVGMKNFYEELRNLKNNT